MVGRFGSTIVSGPGQKCPVSRCAASGHAVTYRRATSTSQT
jgi:hypothetical protein